MTPSQIDLSTIRTMADIQSKARPSGVAGISTNLSSRLSAVAKNVQKIKGAPDEISDTY